MRFLQAYKRLDNLCRDMNGIGVPGYIEDMKNHPNGEYKVTGWKEDFFQLKHYRHIRNRIAHDVDAQEEYLCSDADADWIERFHQRILTQTDPLALYAQATKPAPKPHNRVTAAPPVQPAPNPAPSRKKGAVCKIIFYTLLFFAILGACAWLIGYFAP